MISSKGVIGSNPDQFTGVVPGLDGCGPITPNSSLPEKRGQCEPRLWAGSHHGCTALQLHLGQSVSLMRDFPMEEIPESVAELFDDANGDLAVGDLAAAVEKYRKCTELEPTFFDGWHALGMALMKNGQYPEAIEAGNKAVELRPNDQLAWSSLSLFYVRNHQIKEAEAASGKARILSWGGKIVRDTDKPRS